MKKLSLELFKEKFASDSKTQVIEELTGGILGHCHCGHGFINYYHKTTGGHAGHYHG